MVECDAYEVARVVLRGLAPEELSGLPDVWSDYWADPVPPAGLSDRAAGWAPLVAAYLGAEVAPGRAKIRRRMARLWSTPPKFAVDVAQLDAVVERARAAALVAHRSDADAEAFAAAVMAALAVVDGIRATRRVPG